MGVAVGIGDGVGVVAVIVEVVGEKKVVGALTPNKRVADKIIKMTTNNISLSISVF